MKLSKVRYLFILLILISFFAAVSCSKVNESAQEIATAPTETVTKTTAEQVTTTTATKTTVTETTQNKDFQLFMEAIKEYDPIKSGKAVSYAKVAYDISLDLLNEKIDKEKAGLRFGDLHSQIQKDYMVIAVSGEGILNNSGIENVAPEMIKVIDLINEWADTLQDQYEYTARYYWQEGAEYKIKADELSKKANDIIDEYKSLLDLMK